MNSAVLTSPSQRRTIAVELLLAARELARKKVRKTGIVSYSLQEPTDATLFAAAKSEISNGS